MEDGEGVGQANRSVLQISGFSLIHINVNS